MATMENKIKIFTSGAKAPWCQLPRIEKAFAELGHTVVNDPYEADLIYANNPWYDDVIRLLDDDKQKIRAKVILNVLDIPLHILHEFDVNKLTSQLGRANCVTTISRFTQECVNKYCGINSEIIYQPIMPVTKSKELGESKLYKYLFVGRKNDANKRVGVGVHALWVLGVKGDEVAMVGHEPVSWGQNLGLLKEEWLNVVYNGADFVFCLGKIEGLSLTVIEAMAAGAIPIVCNDLTTRQELLPSELFPEYDIVNPNPTSIAMFIAQFQQDNSAKEKFKKRILEHYQNNLEQKFKPVSVAQKILKIYAGL